MVDFSANILAYIEGRPFYPLPFFKEALSKVPRLNSTETLHIWDCATGPNAAVTIGLVEALHDLRTQDACVESFPFKHSRITIHATDANAEIVAAAEAHFKNHLCTRPHLGKDVTVQFSQAAAEVGPQTLPKGEKLSLVLVGNALHWFDLERFYDVLKTISKRDALLVAWTHRIIPTVANSPALQHELISIGNELHPRESKPSQTFVSSDNGYDGIAWPFTGVEFGAHTIRKFLTADTMKDFWNSHFPRKGNKTLEVVLSNRIESAWPTPSLPLCFHWPMRIRAGRITPMAR